MQTDRCDCLGPWCLAPHDLPIDPAQANAGEDNPKGWDA